MKECVDEMGEIISQTLLKFPQKLERFKVGDVKLKRVFYGAINEKASREIGTKPFKQMIR